LSMKKSSMILADSYVQQKTQGLKGIKRSFISHERAERQIEFIFAASS